MTDLLLTVWLINWLVVDWNIISGWQAWLTISTHVFKAQVKFSEFSLYDYLSETFLVCTSLIAPRRDFAQRRNPEEAP